MTYPISLVNPLHPENYMKVWGGGGVVLFSTKFHEYAFIGLKVTEWTKFPYFFKYQKRK